MEQLVEVTCPWCEEPASVYVDASEIEGEVAADCPICAHPFHVHYQARLGKVIRASPECG